MLERTTSRSGDAQRKVNQNERWRRARMTRSSKAVPQRTRSKPLLSALAREGRTADKPLSAPADPQASVRESALSTAKVVAFSTAPPALSAPVDLDPHGHYVEEELRPSIFEAMEDEERQEMAEGPIGSVLSSTTAADRDSIGNQPQSMKSEIVRSATPMLLEEIGQLLSRHSAAKADFPSDPVNPASEVADTVESTKVGKVELPETVFSGSTSAVETRPASVVLPLSAKTQNTFNGEIMPSPAKTPYEQSETDGPMESDTLAVDAGRLILDSEQRAAALLFAVCIMLVFVVMWKTRAWCALFIRDRAREYDYEKVLREDTPPHSPVVKDVVIVQSIFTSPPRKNVARSRRNSVQASVDSLPQSLLPGSRRGSFSSLPSASTASTENTPPEMPRPKLLHRHSLPSHAMDDTAISAQRNVAEKVQQSGRTRHKSAASVGSTPAGTNSVPLGLPVLAAGKDSHRRRPVPFQLRAALGDLLPTVMASPTFPYAPATQNLDTVAKTWEPAPHN